MSFSSSLFDGRYAGELLDSVPTGIVVTIQNGIIVYLNAEAERLFGYERDELIDKNIDVLLPERFAHHHHTLREGYLAAPCTRHMGTGRDLFGRRKNGTEFPLEVGLRPITTSNDALAPAMIVASIVDISGRKASQARFERVIEASPYGKLLVDSQGTIQLINASLLNLFGYNREELIGQSMDILLPERYRQDHCRHRQDYNACPSLRAMGAGRDLTGLHKNGTEIPIEIGLSPVDSEKGQLTLAVINDITERKRLELNAQQAKAHMEEFTYVASHDLKSPLRGISDLIDWIAEDLGDQAPPSVHNNINRIKLRIERMERLTDDLLHYARSGTRTKESILIDIPQLLNGIIELQPIPSHFNIQTHIGITQMFTAKTPLETVLRNLFSNAIKHFEGANPIIELHAEAAGNYCLFKIIDNGPGIPATAQERVFRLFQTLNNKNKEGSGIGLAIAKRLTESHGGRIELLASPHQSGCCFHVWWPRFARKDIYE